jgi:UDP-N-acetylmuramate--alanine ligase
MSSSSSQPLAGRRLWIAGIGGAGMSAYALLAHAWGAEVAGWDRHETPFLAHLEGIDVTVSEEPPPPSGWEVFVSTAYAGQVEGSPRAALLAELVALRRSIVVAGAHGKTTTSAMIAFCLDRLGADPAFLIGGEIPQLGGNAGAGSGWLVVEGDESDGTVASLRPEIGVLLNVDLDVHHANVGTRAGLEAMFEEWLAHVPKVVRAEELEPVPFELAVPGEHNRRNAAAAIAALELAGIERADSERAIREFRGAGRRLEPKGEAGGVRVLDSYAHHPAELTADLAALRGDGRVLALFQPHLYSRTRHLAHGFAVALATADAACVTEIYPAREAPIPGVTGRSIVDELAALRPGMRLGWAPDPEDAARIVAGWARPGDVVVTLGAGNVDRVAPRLLELLA